MDNFQYRPLNTSKNNNLSKPKLKKSWKDILVRVGLGLAAFAGVGILSFIVLILVVSADLPDINDTNNLLLAQSTTIYDRDGKVLYVKHGDQDREYVSYDEISPHLIDATVAFEDHRYWDHPGFDMVGIARALIGNFLTGEVNEGGSTLTQQYIKNALLSPEQTYTRKLKELILAVQLEQSFDKKKIIELYLNAISYGGTAYGVEKASQIYFGKSAKDVDIAEAAVLASIPNAPSHFSPYGDYLYSQLNKKFTSEEILFRNIKTHEDLKSEEFTRGLLGRMVELDDTHSIYLHGQADDVLRDMYERGYITEEEKRVAWEKLQTIKFEKRAETMQHPHFVFYVLKQLEEKYGKTVVEQGGLKVYTTLDADLQEIAERVVSEGAASNAKAFNAKNAALIALDPTTGHILAMVGSKDFDATDIDGQLNITTSYLQPGSTFKPLVYAQAFYGGYGPGSVVFDVSTDFGDGTPPKNYDGKFRGPMSIRNALGQSRNIPAVKAYYLAGEKGPIMERAQKMGIHFAQENPDVSWSLALGSLEVRPIDMASAYGVFANNGIHHEPVAITKIENAQSEILEEYTKQTGEEALDPQIAYLINSILSDKEASLGGNLIVPGHITAAKTGTSDVKVQGRYYPHDLWTVGYTPNLSVAVWAGNNKFEDGLLYASADGVTAAAPIWNKFMREALKKYPSSEFTVPQGIVTKTISKLTGKLASVHTPEDEKITEVFASFAVPTEEDVGDQEIMIDIRNNKLANNYCPPKFVAKRIFVGLHDIASYPNWEKGVQDWIKENMAQLVGSTSTESELQDSPFVPEGVVDSAPVRVIGPVPTEESELCTLENLEQKPEVDILTPLPFAEVQSNSTIQVTIRASAFYLIDKVEYLLDGTLAYTALDLPYTGIIRLPQDTQDRIDHIITVRVTDKGGYTTEKNLTVVSRLSLDDADQDATDEPITDEPLDEEDGELPDSTDNPTDNSPSQNSSDEVPSTVEQDSENGVNEPIG